MKKLMFVLLGALTGIIIAIAFETDENKIEDDPVKTAEEEENRKKGFHCLSVWDGSHQEFKEAIKKVMRDPDSFEHVETKVTPVSETGTHNIFMTYRARNGFGGMNVETAVGEYNNSDCAFQVLAVQ